MNEYEIPQVVKRIKNKDCVNIILVASKDMHDGVPDDWFLTQALSSDSLSSKDISYEWKLWDSNWDAVESTEEKHVIVVRSLWEGFDKIIGTTNSLSKFYKLAAKCCPRLKLDYDLLDWIGHKKYLLALEAQGVPIVPTVIFRCSSSAGSSSVTDEWSSPGAVKRAMEARGWPDAILKPAVGTT
jgi:hypothetical protein